MGKIGKRSRTQSVVYIGLTVALLAVSAWVSVPLGPVPFTLQTFVLAFAVLVLAPFECLGAIACYLALGAVGVPVFSGMRGGIGMLAGATGGFLWGFLAGAAAGLLVLSAVRRVAQRRASADDGANGSAGKRSGWMMWAGDFAACLAMLAVSYACGWLQLMAVASLGPYAAFLTAIAPFIVIDLVKLAVAVGVAQAVRRAVPSFRHAAARR